MTFTPVAKFTTIHLLLAIATIDNMDIDQMDVVTAFLNSELNEEEAVYMKALDGARLQPRTIVRLCHILYRLKQSPQKWNDKLNEFLLQKMNFTRSVNDPALYWKTRDNGTSYLLVYIDDILIFILKGSNS